MKDNTVASSTIGYDEEGQILGWSSRWPMLEGGVEEAHKF